VNAAVTAMRPTPGRGPYLSPEQVCELVPGLTKKRLANLRSLGQGPRYSKPTPQTVVYVESDVHAWVAASMQQTRP
jgi:predicted DNA-binding transcriptional regulator AlpA